MLKAPSRHHGACAFAGCCVLWLKAPRKSSVFCSTVAETPPLRIGVSPAPANAARYVQLSSACPRAFLRGRRLLTCRFERRLLTLPPRIERPKLVFEPIPDYSIDRTRSPGRFCVWKGIPRDGVQIARVGSISYLNSFLLWTVSRRVLFAVLRRV